MRRLVAGFLFAALLAPADDTVTTADGKVFKGRISRQDDREVVIETYEEETVTLERAKVRQIKSGPGPWEEYDKRVGTRPPKTASDHAALGTWCKGKGLTKKARHHFEEAVRLDPDHAAARRELGYVRVGDVWVPREKEAEERARQKAEQERLAKLVPWSFTVTYAGDIPKDWYDRTNFRDRMMHGAKILWWASRGQMYLKEITIEDQKAQPGDFVMDSLDKIQEKGGAYGKGPPGGPITVGGLFGGGTIVHEMMHIRLYLADEYGCPDCVMTQPKKGWGEPDFCDDRTHDRSKRGSSCWEALKKKYPTLRWPKETKESLGNYHSPPREWGPMPEPKIIIRDH